MSFLSFACCQIHCQLLKSWSSLVEPPVAVSSHVDSVDPEGRMPEHTFVPIPEEASWVPFTTSSVIPENFWADPPPWLSVAQSSWLPSFKTLPSSSKNGLAGLPSATPATSSRMPANTPIQITRATLERGDRLPRSIMVRTPSVGSVQRVKGRG